MPDGFNRGLKNDRTTQLFCRFHRRLCCHLIDNVEGADSVSALSGILQYFFHVYITHFMTSFLILILFCAVSRVHKPTLIADYLVAGGKARQIAWLCGNNHTVDQIAEFVLD
ncbi:hypothetical protein SDC9_180656 [bioreactor metagenome]|uniref:Uncharacterized protein n=1 Tax=bioreactor metagenome TaxID=1076179 RepID=A0A645H4C4_9ZZZZ